MARRAGGEGGGEAHTSLFANMWRLFTRSPKHTSPSPLKLNYNTLRKRLRVCRHDKGRQPGGAIPVVTSSSLLVDINLRRDQVMYTVWRRYTYTPTTVIFLRGATFPGARAALTSHAVRLTNSILKRRFKILIRFISRNWYFSRDLPSFNWNVSMLLF